MGYKNKGGYVRKKGGYKKSFKKSRGKRLNTYKMKRGGGKL